MKVKTGSPFEGQGKRNVFCPYYSECLDLVVRKSWMQWNCSKCTQRFSNEGEPMILQNVDYCIAYYELRRER